ncbi:MAG: DUF3877 family protein [Bacteroidales bacterium]|nr:DUF3877 family protein [Lachnoclostridium sp.]MCM1385178.1 DUF3877 family protein [Lachnoclostridium sp.]MCM1466025.1 DUF3877 family protein [Bacteroidales bacterium]
MNCDKLITNMTDQIKEAQLKLGYAEETVRLYYPLSSLRRLLREDDTDTVGSLAADAGTVLTALETEFKNQENCPLGKLSFKLHKDRVEISIPPAGVRYVHEQVEEPVFLSALIELFQTKHHCGIEDVRRVFESFSQDYVCEKLSREAAEHMGFDYVLYFTDEAEDRYYYCVKEEMGHTVYHRFTKEDYEELGTEAEPGA